MEASYLYIVILAYLVYIIGLTIIPIFVLLKQNLKSIASANKHFYKNCSEEKFKICCWFKRKFFLPVKLKPKEQLSLAFFVTGIGSVFLSATAMMVTALYPSSDHIYYNQLLAIFVGLWAPNLILLSLYFKK